MNRSSNRWIAALAVLALGSLLLVAMASAHRSATKYPAAEVTAGKKVFISVAGCGKCHVLSQAKSHGAVGPNLNTIKPSYSTIVNQVTNGGRFMPPFGAVQGGPLSTKQINDVAAFVYTSEH
jgi:mono/diheme cytochrome c family protein